MVPISECRGNHSINLRMSRMNRGKGPPTEHTPYRATPASSVPTTRENTQLRVQFKWSSWKHNSHTHKLFPWQHRFSEETIERALLFCGSTTSNSACSQVHSGKQFSCGEQFQTQRADTAPWPPGQTWSLRGYLKTTNTFSRGPSQDHGGRNKMKPQPSGRPTTPQRSKCLIRLITDYRNPLGFSYQNQTWVLVKQNGVANAGGHYFPRGGLSPQWSYMSADPALGFLIFKSFLMREKKNS